MIYIILGSIFITLITILIFFKLKNKNKINNKINSDGLNENSTNTKLIVNKGEKLDLVNFVRSQKYNSSNSNSNSNFNLDNQDNLTSQQQYIATNLLKTGINIKKDRT